MKNWNQPQIEALEIKATAQIREICESIDDVETGAMGYTLDASGNKISATMHHPKNTSNEQ